MSENGFEKPFTTETITQAEIDFLNHLRLGFFPVLGWDRARNLSLSSRWSEDILKYSISRSNRPLVESDLDTLRLFAEKQTELLVATKMLVTRFERQKSASETADTRSEIKKSLEKRDREKVKNGPSENKARQSPGKKSYTPEERVIRDLRKAFPTMSKDKLADIALPTLKTGNIAVDHASLMRIIEGLEA